MRSAPALLAISLLGCAPEPAVRPQLVVLVDTDAPVPRFGDRLLIEVLRLDGTPCERCRRVVDVSQIGNWPLSFGVAEGFDSLRLRLYRTKDANSEGLAEPGVTIDRLARLPSVTEGVETVRATLRMDCIGRPANLASMTTCVDAGKLGIDAPPLGTDDGSGSLVGSWLPARSTPCSGAAAADEVCIPGGAYFMGDAQLDPASAPVHLVRLQPFFLDVDEVSVGVIRPFIYAYLVKHNFSTNDVFGHSSNPADELFRCTIPQNPGSNSAFDALPVNCITRAVAAKYCASIGKRLPSEAEWEWAARHGDREHTFAWGTTSVPECSEVTLARTPVGSSLQLYDSARCTFPGNALMPLPIASGSRDISSHGVRDLGGGMREMLADDWQPFSGSCWSEPTRINKACAVGGGSYVKRGAGWNDDTDRAHVALRSPASEGLYGTTLGFRCARNDDGKEPPKRPAPPKAFAEAVCQSNPAPLWRLRDAKIASSSIFSNAYIPGFLLDGKTDTAWFAESAPKEVWVELRLPMSAEVSRVELLGITHPKLAEGSDWLAARIELWGDSLVRSDSLQLASPSADGAIDYPAAVAGVHKVRVVAIDWQNKGAGTVKDSPGFSELHVFGRCEKK